MHHNHRRRKKRSNYGMRTVEINRGCNGFGFTISGQQPCILSCVVANSPAELAGLRAGDFLISVNGFNVSKLPHESIVHLIGNSLGTIKMQIAENYFSDSSEEENIVNHIIRVKPNYLQHKLKINKIRNLPQKQIINGHDNIMFFEEEPSLRSATKDTQPISHNIIHSPNASTSKDISNVSAMVKRVDNIFIKSAPLEYRAIVGYLGTIEMPKQIATSSKLQTVRSCIRKMRHEKRNPTMVLLTILPNYLTLRNSSATMLATYPASRLNYVSSLSESENRFFGLVTSAVYANIDEDCSRTSKENSQHQIRDVMVSNSCHVFVVETKICEHIRHEQKALEFKITCTKDPISNLCLEFPCNSEYVVNLIRSMYTMKVLPQNNHSLYSSNSRLIERSSNGPQQDNLQASSPQPSNHSEITTASSNSDSGIGFYNDCTNISDRILIVDFPGLILNRSVNINSMRPLAICNNFEPVVTGGVGKPIISVHGKSSSADFNTKLTVRAMPDRTTKSFQTSAIPDLLATFGLKNIVSPLMTTRSCDDVISLVERDNFISKNAKQQISMDDINILSHSFKKNVNECIFIKPTKFSKILKKESLPCKGMSNSITERDLKLISYKLSPKVYGLSKPSSMSYQDLTRKVPDEADIFETYGSLQNIHKRSNMEKFAWNFLEGTYSEPNLVSTVQLTTTYPFHRWGQSAFQAPRTTDSKDKLSRQSSSLTLSETDTYIKSTNELGNDSQNDNNVLFSEQNIKEVVKENNVSSWSASFEKLLKDSIGIHTFTEFLRKEFSAENIYFWTACERYRRTESNIERAAQATEIFSKHLADGAPEPVNVDSCARNTVEENLHLAEIHLFDQAQKQIFNLMKFDSYQRFVRSELFRKCLEAEAKNEPLPYPGDKVDDLLSTVPHYFVTPKLKKSASNAENRHRVSLLPWHRKTRCRSKDRPETVTRIDSISKSTSSGNFLKSSSTNSGSDIHSSRSSLTNFDVTAVMGNKLDNVNSISLCRVMLSDGATTIVQTRPNETIRELAQRLLEKRGIHYRFFDVIVNDDSKSIDLENPAISIAGKEVHIEQRIVFKLNLPGPKVISVKSKPKKTLSDVLRPILHKYNYRFEDVQLLEKESFEKLDTSFPVSVADGQRLLIVPVKNEVFLSDSQQYPNRYEYSFSSSNQPDLSKNKVTLSKGLKPNTSAQSTLDEITNKVFSELLQEKVELHANQNLLQKHLDQYSIRSEECTSETSSIFERLHNKSYNYPITKMLKPKKSNLYNQSSTTSDDRMSLFIQNPSVSDSVSSGVKKPIIAKWKSGAIPQVTGRVENHDDFLEGLNRAQRARLEDQRGTEINSELPDFLKNKENLNIAYKLGKVRLNIASPAENLTSCYNDENLLATETPQPTPRLTISKHIIKATPAGITSDANAVEVTVDRNTQTNSDYGEYRLISKYPPPLPPKPKILPIKPSNWGQNNAVKNTVSSKNSTNVLRKPTTSSERNGRNVYLDQPSSSFV